MDLLRRLTEMLRPSGEEGSPTVPAAPPVPAPEPSPRIARPRGSAATFGIDTLASRLETTAQELRAVPIAYRTFTIPKRGGGQRVISAPEAPLRDVQRQIDRRLLARLVCHPAAIGFERGRSLVEHAGLHAGRAVVLRMDVRDFFTATVASRIWAFFAALGWDGETAELLTRLTTLDGHLPQGAPTSPRLSNLLNARLDARCAGIAAKVGARYSRYADDLTFSFDIDDPDAVRLAIRLTKHVLLQDGYQLHEKRKLHVRRRHQRQLVGGLVVNDRPALPRERRRWLRAIEHHVSAGRAVSLRPEQLAGWRAYASMVISGSQRGDSMSPSANRS